MARSRENIKKANGTKIISDLLSADVPPENFLAELLVAQCRRADADAGVILREGRDNRMEVLAAYSGNGDHATAPLRSTLTVPCSGPVGLL